LALALVAALALTGAANRPAAAQSGVWYETYITQPGDSLAKIARQNCTTWEEIYSLNRDIIGPDSSVLSPGTRLTVPNRCGSGGSPSGVYDRGPRLHANGTVNGNVYTVAWGDTLYSVSERFGVPVEELMRVNGLTSSKIYSGQQLIIPGLSSQPTPPPSNITVNSPVPGTWLHTSFVVSGSGVNLFEGNVGVRVKDGNGNVIAEQPTILQGTNVGTGGPGVWSVQFTNVIAQPQSNGWIEAYSPGTSAFDSVAVWFYGY
jgi:LysM repeat protein